MSQKARFAEDPMSQKARFAEDTIRRRASSPKAHETSPRGFTLSLIARADLM